MLVIGGDLARLPCFSGVHAFVVGAVSAHRDREILRIVRDAAPDKRLRVDAAIVSYELAAKPPYLERIPVRHREEVVIVPTQQIASIVAEGELLHITTVRNGRHTITYRLKDLERRLDPARFIRLGRGTLANVDLITKVSVMPGGTHVALLANGQKLPISRLQSRVLRERFLKL